MRMLRTGTGRGQLLGTATVNFYASSERTIDACSVHWDSDLGYAAVLPALAFDEWLPNLRSVSVQTDAGPGELRGKDAQLWELGEAEDWLAGAEAQLAAGEIPRFDALPIVAEYDGDVVACAEVTVRLNHRKQRLWAEVDIEPSEGEQLLFSVVRKVLWDWAVDNPSLPIDPAELVAQMSAQSEHYREHGIPSSFMLRELGTAPYAVWIDHPTVPLP